MAGASAGGLNGVIYAASQVYGFHTQELRDAWLDLGDLKEMVRGSGAGNVAAETAGAEVYPSLLHGDGYFFAKTHETLLNWWRRAATAGPIRRPGSISR